MKATITRYVMTYPVYKDYYRGTIKKATKTYKTEAEAKQAMVKYAKENTQIVKEADPMIWQIKKVVKNVEIDD